MKIIWTPQLSYKPISYEIDGETITITRFGARSVVRLEDVLNGEHYTGEKDQFGAVRQAWREDSILNVVLVRPHLPDASEAERFPAPTVVHAGAFAFPARGVRLP